MKPKTSGTDRTMPLATWCPGKEYMPLCVPEEVPVLIRKIGKTTYKVRVHFSDTSTETMSDKIKRMLKNEIQQM